jgi:hypothetical protein
LLLCSLSGCTWQGANPNTVCWAGGCWQRATQALPPLGSPAAQQTPSVSYAAQPTPSANNTTMLVPNGRGNASETEKDVQRRLSTYPKWAGCKEYETPSAGSQISCTVDPFSPVGIKNAEAARAAKVSTHSARWVLMVPPPTKIPHDFAELVSRRSGSLLVNPNGKWFPAGVAKSSGRAHIFKSEDECERTRQEKLGMVAILVAHDMSAMQCVSATGMPLRNMCASLSDQRTYMETLQVRDGLLYGTCEER